MNEITFDQLPKAVAQLLDEVASIKSMLAEKGDAKPTGDQLLTIQECAAILHLSVPTIYGLVHRKEIPVSKKGKRLYFSKDEINAWIKTGRKMTVSEIQVEAEQQFMKTHKMK
jgi:excisionase family DNA binding protein